MDGDVRVAQALTPEVIDFLSDTVSRPDERIEKRTVPGVGEFYIYRIFGQMGETLYIGKGCGNRLRVQKRKFGCDGEILQRYRSEAAAYKAEVRLIKRFDPPLNKNLGGAGGCAGKGSNATMRLIKRIGTRAYAARILLWCYHHPNDELHKLVDHRKYDQIRRIAYGSPDLIMENQNA